ncbi:MAG TPA: pyruvate kinase [Nitrososphaeraceae archaeon]|nr:pyruvate kinase [Nitrososphaeraceae archaeon]
MSTKPEEDKSREDENEDLDIIGCRLNEMYHNTINLALQAQGKLLCNIAETENKCSYHNLLCYLALREYDLADLQLRLSEHGLSSLESLESHVLVSIEQVLKHFKIGPANTSSGLCKIKSHESSSILAKRTELLFGQPNNGRRTHIMITLDSSDIFRYELIEQLLENGLEIARINCAHNTKAEWKLLIESIRSAEERLNQRGIRMGHNCKILMDLAGPKIRTGPFELQSRPLKIFVPEDAHEQPVRFAEGLLDSEANQSELVNLERPQLSSFVIAISKIDCGGLASLRLGQKITFRDARDERRCIMTVLERLSPTKVRVGLEHTAWLKEGTKLECQRTTVADSSSDVDGGKADCVDNSECSLIVGHIKPQPAEIKVEYGNTLRLYRDNNRLGHAGDRSSNNTPAGISCTHSEVLDQVLVGHRVFIDDGKIEGIVRSSNESYLEVEIISPKGIVAEIKPNKGINFPDSSIIMPALTAEDIRNLEFVVQYADLVALSYVHRPEDIYDLRKELSKIDGGEHLSILAKIETADSVHNLARILIAGLELSKFGILIARGDLAVEVGFENLPFVQEDILCLCEAAHIPVVLATQILESLAESGLRTRPEITDAIMGQRAECVMLNNGTHILEALKALARLLNTQELHQIKKHKILREFPTLQCGIFEGKRC